MTINPLVPSNPLSVPRNALVPWRLNTIESGVEVKLTLFPTVLAVVSTGNTSLTQSSWVPQSLLDTKTVVAWIVPVTDTATGLIG